jgi:sugar lactone lactonase YvrE
MRADATAVEGLGFPESLRWRDGALWFSDMFRGRVVRWVPGDDPEVMLSVADGGPDVPGGLGWLPDGALLVVDCEGRRVIRVDDGGLTVHAELARLFSHPANDMHVDPDGVSWVGGYGFDPDVDPPRPSQLARVAADGSAVGWGDPLVFPNGCERRADGRLVVAETFADRVSTLDPRGRRVTQAQLPAGSGPDGLSLDALGRVHVALAFAGSIVRIDGAEVMELWRAEPVTEGPGSGPRGCYDCAVSPDGSRLAVAIASLDEGLAARIDTGAVILVPLDAAGEPAAFQKHAQSVIDGSAEAGEVGPACFSPATDHSRPDEGRP